MIIKYSVIPNMDSLGRLCTYTHCIVAEKGSKRATYHFDSESPVKLKLFEGADNGERDIDKG